MMPKQKSTDEKSAASARRSYGASKSFSSTQLSRAVEFRRIIAEGSKQALSKMPARKSLEGHWNNSARVLIVNIYDRLLEAQRAMEDCWSLERCNQFVLYFDATLGALDVGWDLGFRDATGVVFQRKGTNNDPHGCGNAPSYPEGASCSLRCSMEREWQLCRAGCGDTVDCSSWPCFACISANLDHAICAADCIFSQPQPQSDRLNPASVATLMFLD